MLEWEQENEAVFRTTTLGELHQLQTTRIKNAKTLLVRVYDELKVDMTKFFQDSKHRTILEQ